MEYAIAVIDIGMTNKKVAVYDESLEQKDAVYKNFAPLNVIDPLTSQTLEAHDIDGMKAWFFNQIKLFAQKYPIKAISVTTHGATFVCLDKNGKQSVPCILYTHEPGEQFHANFYAKVGNKDELQRETCTPPLSAMINPAKGVYFMQTHFTQAFKNTAMILNYPQYWGFALTGQTGFEPTYIGCHTYLWDPEKEKYSRVADVLGIKNLLPSNLRNSYEILGTLTPEAAKETGLAPETPVTMGIHDSNASLLPYLAKDDRKDFVLNSTGTWCVCMHPQETLGFNEDDIGKIVFFNQSALRKPVKTAIFLGGAELDAYVTLFKELNGTDTFPQSDMETCRNLFTEQKTFLLPELIRGSGQFAASKPGIMENGVWYSFAEIKSGTKIPSVMKDEKRFFALLDASLVIQTETALKRSGLTEGTSVFTEGGFRQNTLYNTLLASVLPHNSVYLTSMKEATACGAAMTALMAVTGKSHRDLAGSIQIEYKPVPALEVGNWVSYKAAWLTHAAAQV